MTTFWFNKIAMKLYIRTAHLIDSAVLNHFVRFKSLCYEKPIISAVILAATAALSPSMS